MDEDTRCASISLQWKPYTEKKKRGTRTREQCKKRLQNENHEQQTITRRDGRVIASAGFQKYGKGQGAQQYGCGQLESDTFHRRLA